MTFRGGYSTSSPAIEGFMFGLGFVFGWVGTFFGTFDR